MGERLLSKFTGLPVIFEATTLSTLLVFVRDTTFYNVQCNETVLRDYHRTSTKHLVACTAYSS